MGCLRSVMNNFSLSHCLDNRERVLSHLNKFTKSNRLQLTEYVTICCGVYIFACLCWGFFLCFCFCFVLLSKMSNGKGKERVGQYLAFKIFQFLDQGKHSYLFQCWKHLVIFSGNNSSFQQLQTQLTMFTRQLQHTHGENKVLGHCSPF